jgi:hypothetical protein
MPQKVLDLRLQQLRHDHRGSARTRAVALRYDGATPRRSKLEWYGMRDLLFSAKRASSVCEGSFQNGSARHGRLKIAATQTDPPNPISPVANP